MSVQQHSSTCSSSWGGFSVEDASLEPITVFTIGLPCIATLHNRHLLMMRIAQAHLSDPYSVVSVATDMFQHVPTAMFQLTCCKHVPL